MKQKTKNRKAALMLVVVMLMGALCGCSEDMDIALNEDGSGTLKQTVMIEKEYLDSSTTSTSDEGWVCEDVVEDGVSYQKRTKTISFQKLDDLKEEWASNATFVFTKNKFSLKSSSVSVGTTVQSSTNMESMKKVLQCSYTITFPYSVKKTNGTIQSDGKTVVWDNDQVYDEGILWAVFSDSLLDKSSIAAPKISGAKNNGYYKKQVKITASSKSIITSMTVNGTKIDSDTCIITKEGKNKVVCKDVNGKTKKITFVIDTKKPKVTGVSNGKTYKSTRTIKFSDKNGIKSAKLNGKKISSGKKVKKKGTYKLVVTDRAGNKTTVKFKIK